MIPIVKAAVFVLLALLSAAAMPQPNDGIISAEEALAMARTGRVILIDIRTPDEWRQTGVPAGAQRANASDPQGPAAFLQNILDIVGDQRAQPIAIICRTGNRTTKARAYLMSKGFTEVYNVKEGVAGSDAGDGWLKRGLPTEPCKC